VKRLKGLFHTSYLNIDRFENSTELHKPVENESIQGSDINGSHFGMRRGRLGGFIRTTAASTR